jgi:hypothetical protein
METPVRRFGMKTEDGQEVQIDLMMAFVHFRLYCGQIARKQEWIEQHPKACQADERFEEELEILNKMLRAWWKDYKQNWRNVRPGPDLAMNRRTNR